MRRKASRLLVGGLLLLSACSGPTKAPTSSPAPPGESGSQSGPLAGGAEIPSLVTAQGEIQFQQLESKRDIDGQGGLFVFAEVVNTSQATIYPETIWRTQVALVAAGSDSHESLYATVLTKEELDGSPYKTASDQLSQPLEPGESATVGYFYGVGEKAVELVLYDEEFIEQSRTKITAIAK